MIQPRFAQAYQPQVYLSTLVVGRARRISACYQDQQLQAHCVIAIGGK
jgi:hypothetical protein